MAPGEHLGAFPLGRCSLYQFPRHILMEIFLVVTAKQGRRQSASNKGLLTLALHVGADGVLTSFPHDGGLPAPATAFIGIDPESTSH